MESWSFGQTSGRRARRVAAALLALGAVVAGPDVAGAQAVSPSEREALVRLRVDQGGRAEEVDILIGHVNQAAANELPVAPLLSKIREGFAKGVEPVRIESVIEQMAVHLEAADRLLQDLTPASGGAAREAAVVLLAEAFGGGVTTDETGDIGRQAQTTNRPVSAEALASAAKGLSFIKEVRLPVAAGTAVMAEAVRQDYRPYEMLDLGRAIKQREADYRAGRASLAALRDAIARGDRPGELFRDRPAIERPPARREVPVERPVRPEPPERPQRPERPAAGRTR